MKQSYIIGTVSLAGAGLLIRNIKIKRKNERGEKMRK